MLNKKKFAERLKELRRTKAVSTRSLANAVGLKSHGAITQFEKGSSLPALDTLVALAEFFGVTLDYLVGLTDFPQPIPDNIKKIVEQTDHPEALMIILNQINIDEKGQILLHSEENRKGENEIKELMKGLDQESILELHKFLRYLHTRQSLGEIDELSAGLDITPQKSQAR
jgi:transcriptional regulator with XRE-family HTH domain